MEHRASKRISSFKHFVTSSDVLVWNKHFGLSWNFDHLLTKYIPSLKNINLIYQRKEIIIINSWEEKARRTKEPLISSIKLSLLEISAFFQSRNKYLRLKWKVLLKKFFLESIVSFQSLSNLAILLPSSHSYPFIQASSESEPKILTESLHRNQVSAKLKNHSELNLNIIESYQCPNLSFRDLSTYQFSNSSTLREPGSNSISQNLNRNIATFWRQIGRLGYRRSRLF